MRCFAIIAAVTISHLCYATDRREPAGMSNDGREAENVGIYLVAGESGDWISERCYAIHWTYDDASQTVTVKFHVEAHERPAAMHLRYEAATDSLTVLDSDDRPSERTFRRATQTYTDWRLHVKSQQHH